MTYNFSKALIVTKAARRQKLKFLKSDNIAHAGQTYVGLTAKQGKELYQSCLRYKKHPHFQGYGENLDNHILKIDDVLFYWPKEKAA